MSYFSSDTKKGQKKVGFYTELTKEGTKNSIDKIKQLEKLNIDKIFVALLLDD